MCADLVWFIHLLEVRICFFIFVFMTSNFMCLSFFFPSFSLWTTDTIIFVELNKPPSLFTPEGLKRRIMVLPDADPIDTEDHELHKS